MLKFSIFMDMKTIIKKILKENHDKLIKSYVNSLKRRGINPLTNIKEFIKFVNDVDIDRNDVKEIVKEIFGGKITNNDYYKSFDQIFDVENVSWNEVYDDNGDVDEKHVHFEEIYDGDYVMEWYDTGYFNNDYEQGRYMNENKTPFVEIDNPYNRNLYMLFGEEFKTPFKKWFEMRFNLKVKTVG
jgi:hypothetical protein